MVCVCVCVCGAALTGAFGDLSAAVQQLDQQQQQRVTTGAGDC